MSKTWRSIIVTSSLVALFLVPMVEAQAQAQKGKRTLLGSFKKWDALISKSGSQRECYMISMPTKSVASKKGARRGDIYLTITHRPQFAVLGEVNAIAGYPLKPSSEVTITVDKRKKYELFTQGNGAWAYDPKDDKSMIKSMKAGSPTQLFGKSARGTRTTDTYRLSGFTAAYNAITKACK